MRAHYFAGHTHSPPAAPGHTRCRCLLAGTFGWAALSEWRWVVSSDAAAVDLLLEVLQKKREQHKTKHFLNDGWIRTTNPKIQIQVI
jgi:hypothetical protein